MPKETKQAVEWALSQTIETPNGLEDITIHHRNDLTELVRDYLNEHEIEYDTFSYLNLEPYF